MFITRTVFICLLSTITMITFNMGMDYVNFGSSYSTALHPYIAFPIAVICTVFIIILYYWDDIRRFMDEE